MILTRATTMVRSTLPPTSPPRGPQVDRTQPVTIRHNLADLGQFSCAPAPNEIVAGCGGARGNSFDICGNSPCQSWVGNRRFHARTKFEKAKFGSNFELFQNFPKPTGTHPKVTQWFPGGNFQFKIGVFQNSEKLCFCPSGPSPGVSGGLPGSLDLPSRAAGVSPGVPGNLLTWCEALFLQLPLPGGHKWTERNL